MTEPICVTERTAFPAREIDVKCVYIYDRTKSLFRFYYITFYYTLITFSIYLSYR